MPLVTYNRPRRIETNTHAYAPGPRGRPDHYHARSPTSTNTGKSVAQPHAAILYGLHAVLVASSMQKFCKAAPCGRRNKAIPAIMAVARGSARSDDLRNKAIPAIMASYLRPS